MTIQYDRVISAAARNLALLLHDLPPRPFEHILEHVFKVLSALFRVSAKEEQSVSVASASRSRPGGRQVSLLYHEVPPISSEIVAEEIVTAILVICAPK